MPDDARILAPIGGQVRVQNKITREFEFVPVTDLVKETFR